CARSSSAPRNWGIPTRARSGEDSTRSDIGLGPRSDVARAHRSSGTRVRASWAHPPQTESSQGVGASAGLTAQPRDEEAVRPIAVRQKLEVARIELIGPLGVLRAERIGGAVRVGRQELVDDAHAL